MNYKIYSTKKLVLHYVHPFFFYNCLNELERESLRESERALINVDPRSDFSLQTKCVVHLQTWVNIVS